MIHHSRKTGHTITTGEQDDSDADIEDADIDESDKWEDREGEDQAADYDRYEYDDEPIDGVGFADPGGESALRAATASNPRNLPCPTCGTPNVLTPLDRRANYQCNRCADRDEGKCYGRG